MPNVILDILSGPQAQTRQAGGHPSVDGAQRQSTASIVHVQFGIVGLIIVSFLALVALHRAGLTINL